MIKREELIINEPFAYFHKRFVEKQALEDSLFMISEFKEYLNNQIETHVFIIQDNIKFGKTGTIDLMSYVECLKDLLEKLDEFRQLLLNTI